MSDELKPAESPVPPLQSQGTTWEKLMFWKLAIAKVGIKAYVALFASVAATLNGVEWSEFTGTQKFMAIGAAGVAVAAVIDAFLSDTMAKMQGKAEAEKKENQE